VLIHFGFSFFCLQSVEGLEPQIELCGLRSWVGSKLDPYTDKREQFYNKLWWFLADLVPVRDTWRVVGWGGTSLLCALLQWSVGWVTGWLLWKLTKCCQRSSSHMGTLHVATARVQCDFVWKFFWILFWFFL